jgi:regulator of protease activity HflC (stomatin/prohibitin superfamily)
VALVIVGIALFVLLVVWLVSGVRLVRPYERGVVERVGKYRGTVNPGLRITIPLIDTVRMVDMREQVLEVPAQEVITKDNVTATVDAAVFYAPTDPEKLVYNVANFTMALGKLTQTNLRNIVGDLQLDEALTGREVIGDGLRLSLDEATDEWGVRVKRVEVQRIDPPAEILTAMHEQTRSERSRKALVTIADGERQAAIARAEGERQARIFEAEADKEARALRAEGDAAALRTMAEAERYQQELVASARASAIKVVYEAIHESKATPEVLAVTYIDALREISDGQATSIFLPSDSRSVMGSLAGITELLKGATARSEGAGAPANGSITPLPPPTSG